MFYTARQDQPAGRSPPTDRRGAEAGGCTRAMRLSLSLGLCHPLAESAEGRVVGSLQSDSSSSPGCLMGTKSGPLFFGPTFWSQLSRVSHLVRACGFPSVSTVTTCAPNCTRPAPSGPQSTPNGSQPLPNYSQPPPQGSPVSLQRPSPTSPRWPFTCICFSTYCPVLVQTALFCKPPAISQTLVKGKHSMGSWPRETSRLTSRPQGTGTFLLYPTRQRPS